VLTIQLLTPYERPMVTESKKSSPYVATVAVGVHSHGPYTLSTFTSRGHLVTSSMQRASPIKLTVSTLGTVAGSTALATDGVSCKKVASKRLMAPVMSFRHSASEGMHMQPPK